MLDFDGDKCPRLHDEYFYLLSSVVVLCLVGGEVKVTWSSHNNKVKSESKFLLGVVAAFATFYFS